MPTPPALSALAKQIAAQQTHLEKLHQEYEARQAQLGELQQRKQELKTQLDQVNAQIKAVNEDAVQVAPAEPTALAQLSWPDRLELLLREAGRPLTIRELSEELQRRGYPTASKNLAKMVSNRLADLRKKGRVRRTKGGKFALRKAASESGEAARSRTPKKSKASPKPAPATPAAHPPLSKMLTDILKRSTAPVPARDLARQVLDAGYQTKSKDFLDVVWTALGNLKDAESVPEQGWRLKKR